MNLTKTKKRILMGFLTAVTVALVLPSIVWEHKRWVVDTTIGGSPAKVSIDWRSTRFIGNHVFHIGGGHWKYRTEVTLTGREKIVFETQLQPRAIWKAGDSYFIACADTGYWFIGKLQPDGTLTQVSKRQTMGGPQSWNLEKPETQAYWQEEYGRWAP